MPQMVPLLFGFFFHWGREWSHSELFVSLPNNSHDLGRCELAQKIGSLDRTESYMLKTETE